MSKPKVMLPVAFAFAMLPTPSPGLELIPAVPLLPVPHAVPCVVRTAGTTLDDLLIGANSSELLPSQRLAFTTDGVYAVAGDTSYNAGAGNFGRAYVFKLSGGTYSQVATLSPPGGSFFEWGWAVAIADDLTILVGDRSNNPWHAFASTGGDTWGVGVAVSTTDDMRALRIARIAGTVALASDIHGFTRIYTGSGASWATAQNLTPSHGGNYAGFAMSPDGKYIVGSNDAGASGIWIDVYRSDDLIAWTRVRSVQVGVGDASGGGNVIGSSFMQVAVSADGSVILAGADGAVNDSGDAVGAVYVLQKSGTATWKKTATLFGSTIISGFGYGSALAISDDGNFMLAGFENFVAPTFHGKAEGLNCLQRKKGRLAWESLPSAVDFTNPHGVTGYRFGGAVAMSGDGQTVGAMGIDFSSASISTLRVFH